MFDNPSNSLNYSATDQIGTCREYETKPKRIWRVEISFLRLYTAMSSRICILATTEKQRRLNYSFQLPLQYRAMWTYSSDLYSERLLELNGNRNWDDVKNLFYVVQLSALLYISNYLTFKIWISERDIWF